MVPFETNLLDAALTRRREDNEAQRLATIEQAIHWLETEGEQYGINEAYLFGSVTRPYRFTDNSDVDVAVEQFNPEDFFVAMAALSETLERDIDLVDLSKCHFAHRIRQQGMVWRRET
ncbi:nucleotidyltransferase domain-containing protein [Leptolyngbya sp. FACHB-671]|uniref:nucleotidyltransferase family protein n=1 Tax=Leptolyngbya sp. FACHB-671 TaxID=2692812 RepID=UPI001687F544|nr:nucleotidyltransferase domain-containing protein [Leptolyngbya sp. FACHB-671]MBD2072307.1 nucleotidyltransferase domain-containing protein [Leptolyngbya sp. FACHB-671]